MLADKLTFYLMLKLCLLKVGKLNVCSTDLEQLISRYISSESAVQGIYLILVGNCKLYAAADAVYSKGIKQ